MISRKHVTIAAFSGAFAVILGAFGAHTLRNILEAKQLATFQTGVQYQFYHSLAILGVACLVTDKTISKKVINTSIVAFTLGIILFSGSLYLLSLKGLLGIESWGKWLGPLTPIGGLCFITGWLLIIYAALRK